MIGRGSSGPDVVTWQRELAKLGLIPDTGCDGEFGPRTEKATITFQIQRGLKPDGIVGPVTLAALSGGRSPTPMTAGLFDRRWQFLQAARCTRVIGPRTVTLVTMHTMQAPGRPDTAEAVASWFSGARGAPPDASSHVCGDQDSLVQCVRPGDIAWGAQRANSIAYHCEQAGFAEWTRERWMQQENMSMLTLMASHVRLALRHFNLPAVSLEDAEVASCVRDSLIAKGTIRGQMSGVAGGICEHRQITDVWQHWDVFGLPNPRKLAKPFWPSHVDCGDGYPMDVFLDLVKQSG